MLGKITVRDSWMMILGFTIGLGIGYIALLGIYQPEIFRLQDELRISEDSCEADSIMFYIADTAMNYIEINHPEIGSSIPKFVSWQGGRITPDGVKEYEEYEYSGEGWKININWRIVNFENITYNILIEHDDLNWSGEISRGIIKELSYEK